MSRKSGSGAGLLLGFITKHKRAIERLPKDDKGQPKPEALRKFLGKPEQLAELGLIVGVMLLGLYLEAEGGAGMAAPAPKGGRP